MMDLFVSLCFRRTPRVESGGTALRSRRLGLLLLGVSGACGFSACKDSGEQIANAPKAPVAEQSEAKAALPPSPGGAQEATDIADPDTALEVAAEKPAEAAKPNVRLLLDVRPRSANAEVFWGRKFLGRAPLDFRHPRNSGPLDIVIRSEEYLPYHTRLFTDRSEKLIVSLVKAEQAQTLLGYRHQPDAGAPVVAPAAVPAGGGGQPQTAASDPPESDQSPGAVSGAVSGAAPDAGALFVIPRLPF